ncbi:MAG TPA: ABC transporter ATP-binding protein [Ktedonobacteraceae bacterium]|nr:ABC transporter ATP-binding protein [Ktedonobacteraceae bacterium]
MVMVKIFSRPAATTAGDTPQKGSRRPPTDQNVIEVYDLVKRYRKAPHNAVDGITFEVRRGEIFGLLGPNGAGKTTTIGILTTRIRPTSGGAAIMGIDVRLDPMMVKRRIAIVPQWSNLDASLRAREILTFHASYHGVSRAEREARADLLLEELGLSQRAQEKVERFSGGLAQRLMLARAQMHSPDVLFLDEPTRSLDPQSRLFLWERIHTLQKQGMTIFLSTHDIHEAERLCERVAIMDHGHILVLDTPTALIKRFIPDGTRLEVTMHVPACASPDLSLLERLFQSLQNLPGITKAEEVSSISDESDQSEKHLFHLYTREPAVLTGSVVQAATALGVEIRDMHLKRPSLEDVFIHLTGRKLRS